MAFNFKNKITEFHYGKKNVMFSVLFFLPYLFYFAAISIKNFLYERGILKEKRANAFVICIGNLTTGGVGKTPVVIEIANYLTSLGKKVVVLSRGYGGKLNNKVPNLVKNYNEILINDADLVGDEVNLISKNVYKAGVVVCSNRLLGANFAVSKLNAEIVLMDDGFSNRKIYKDLNILLIDKEKMFGNGFLLPLGALREPLSQIKRANRVIFVDKGGLQNPKLEAFRASLKVPFFDCEMKGSEIYNIKTGEKIGSGEIVAFSGIGSPNQFYQKLSGFEIKEKISFDDHINYTQKTVDEIMSKIKSNGAIAAITTEKDAVKLEKFDFENFYALKLKPNLDLEELLKEIP